MSSWKLKEQDDSIPQKLLSCDFTIFFCQVSEMAGLVMVPMLWSALVIVTIKEVTSTSCKFAAKIQCGVPILALSPVCVVNHHTHFLGDGTSRKDICQFLTVTVPIRQSISKHFWRRKFCESCTRSWGCFGPMLFHS